MLFILIEIIKAAGEENRDNLDALLKMDRSRLNSDCYDKALKVAVENERHTNAGKLVLVGATNIEEAMKSAKRLDTKLMLFMVKAVLEGDHQLITEIKNIRSNPPSRELDGTVTSHSEDTDHTRNPKYATLHSEEMIKHITEGKLQTRVPIRLAIKQNKSPRVLVELLSITNINYDTGSVRWSDLSLTELDVKWIRNLPKHFVIKQLNLSYNWLNSLPISIAMYLRHCTKLDLQQNNIKSIPSLILELPSLRELILSHNRISELPNALWSASLIQLDLSYNELKTLPDCATELCTDSMKVLRLEYNHLRKVPKCVCFLHSLNTLDLSCNPEILVLPVDLGRLKELTELLLDGLDHLYDPPPSVRENSKTCISYLKSQFLKQGKYYRMKLMLVGRKGVGKTTIVACLRGGRHPGGSTVGVDIGKWSYRPGFRKPSFHFSVWDFAGQEEYYATHQVFLSKRSLYLAVWKVTEGKEGIAELKPWLNNIILRTPGSQILIVATHLDVLITELGKEQAYAKCDEYRTYLTQSIGCDFIERNVAKIKFVGLKGKHENVSELREEIYKAAEDSKVEGLPIMGSSIPASYEKVDSRLLKVPDPGILHSIEFKGMVRGLGQPDLQSDDEIRALTLFLHDIGSLLHFDDHRRNLDDLYFVKPQWLSKLMANVIKEDQRNRYVTGGMITKSDFKKLFILAGKNITENLLEQYLMLFNRFEIALPLDKQGDVLLVPCFLPSKRPIVVDRINKEHYYCRQFVFCELVTPPGLWSRLLSRLMTTVVKVRDVMDQNDNQNGELHYWDKGLHYHSGDLLFVIESSPSQGDGISIVYSLKAAQEGLLSQLVTLVQQIVSEWFPGLKYEQIFYCYGGSKERCNGIFKLDEVLNYLVESKSFICKVCHEDLDLKVLVPDLLLDDLDSKCILDVNSIQYCDQNIIWSGKFQKIYRGSMKFHTSVIVKFYDTAEKDCQLKGYETQLQVFRAEVTYLQRLKHPCLVSMIGVCKYPNIALVMEDGPMGSLDLCLLKELPEVPRIIVYRIGTQIASALRFLHSIPVIHRGLNTSKVLIYSLSLDNLVNCKLGGLQVATYGGDKEHTESTFARQFIAPEVSKQAVYDQRVDIFSFGMVLFQLMQRSYPTELRQSIPEWEIPWPLKSISSIPDSELHHMRTLAKNCCSLNPAGRPDLQVAVEQLCNPEFQLVTDVITINGNVPCACTRSCLQCSTTTASCANCNNTEVWMCCQNVAGAEFISFSSKNWKLESERRQFIKGHQVYDMVSHGEHVWAASSQAGRKGLLLRFDDRKNIVVPVQSKIIKSDNSGLPDSDYGVSLACSDNHVYVGTVNGWCLMFPIDISYDTLPTLEKQLSCHYIRSMVVVKRSSLLWVSAGEHILFVNLSSLEEFNQSRKSANINDGGAGKLLLSPDEEVVWSVRITKHSISAWKAPKQEVICVFDSHKLMDKSIDEQQSRIKSANVVLDTLWVGLISGHILAVSTLLPERALIIMEPYTQLVETLVPIYGKYPMMISVGIDYQLEKQSRTKKQKSVDIVLWEAVSAKHMLQMSYLSAGSAWLNDTSLNEVCWYSCYIVLCLYVLFVQVTEQYTGKQHNMK